MIKHLVVAAYLEDLSWIDDVQNVNKIFVYIKSNKTQPVVDKPIVFERLLNTGHEAQTYFYHIVKHYNELADCTIFTQGNPFDHVPGFFNVVRQPTWDTIWEAATKNAKENRLNQDGFMGLGKFWIESQDNLRKKKNPRLGDMQRIWNCFYNDKLPEYFPNTWGAILAIKKERIYDIGLDFFECILQNHRYWPLFPWSCEYLFPQLMLKRYQKLTKIKHL